jgi:hypothetical protein
VLNLQHGYAGSGLPLAPRVLKPDCGLRQRSIRTTPMHRYWNAS